MCRTYATLLESVYKSVDKSQVSFVAINMRGDRNAHRLKNIVNFPVYQDNIMWNIWSKLGGQKDDFLIFNKCGRLIAHMKSPKLNMSFKKRVWKKIKKGKRCGKKCRNLAVQTIKIRKIVTSG